MLVMMETFWHSSRIALLVVINICILATNTIKSHAGFNYWRGREGVTFAALLELYYLHIAC